MHFSRMLRSLTLFTAVLAYAAVADANDSAASKSSGGIVLTREARISMEKERLTISEKKITVEYEFLNDTDEDITTEVAFPIPTYDAGEYESAAGMRTFDDFHVWIESKEVRYETDTRAFIGKRDITDILNHYHVDIATEGHYNEEFVDIDKLSKQQQAELKQLGIPSIGNMHLGWSVHKTYHWQQTFPAHTTLHVRHEYTPAFGFQELQAQLFTPTVLATDIADLEARAKQNPTDPDRFTFAIKEDKDESNLIKNACIESALQRKLADTVSHYDDKTKQSQGDYVYASWVDYILTTANSWKTPIKNFELIVEKGPDPYGRQPFVSFCWDGPVKKLDATHFQATATDFVPRHELHILFMSVAK